MSERTRQPARAPDRQRHLVRRRRGPRRQAAQEVPRLAHPRRHPLRDAARARLPHADRLRHRRVPRPAAVADRRHHGRGAHRGDAATPPGGSSARTAGPGTSRTTSSSRSTRRSRCSRRGCCARTDARCRSSRLRCAARSPARCGRCRTRTAASRRRSRSETPAVVADDGAERDGRAGHARSASPCSRHCSRTCSRAAERTARRRSRRRRSASASASRRRSSRITSPC